MCFQYKKTHKMHSKKAENLNHWRKTQTNLKKKKTKKFMLIIYFTILKYQIHKTPDNIVKKHNEIQRQV